MCINKKNPPPFYIYIFFSHDPSVFVDGAAEILVFFLRFRIHDLKCD